MRPRVYISGPITKGDRDANFQQAADVHRELMAAGFAVFNPMLSMKFTLRSTAFPCSTTRRI